MKALLIWSLVTSASFAGEIAPRSNPYSNARRGSASYYDSAEILRALTGPYDDAKKDQLSQLGLSQANLIKNRDGATIAERYSNPSETLSARVTRNANSGIITTIEKTMTSSRGSITDKWNISNNTISHTVRQGDKINTVHISTATCTPSFEASAQNRNVKNEICPVLVEYKDTNVATSPSTAAGPTTAPSAVSTAPRAPTSQSSGSR